ncbi:hypothetical protein SORBI_3004G083401 [Sorghum bicolor]|uniref:O-methyltransferase domain-containing protein n=1 Tax=Sorghum bicolor TaxID=4558 RepID=A0A1Z5RLI6_SORBI|nr:hypothetical protein SORBI_3004G083401 [Sorghum bicolor]
MALQSAIKLGIPTAIHRCGGAASLSDLHASLPVPPSKWPCVSRLMKLLAVSGIFKEGEPGVYCLTPVSRLLVEEDIDGGGTACQSQFTVTVTSPFNFAASQCLPEWLQSEDDDDHAAAETPFVMAHGATFYGVMGGRDLEFGASFNEAMAADSRFVAEDPRTPAIAKAFPHVRCSVLELPQVVDKVPVHGTVEFVAGDMMKFVPSADVVLLKFVLHNWSDEDCVKILKQSMSAISTREPKGKVVIIDTVVTSASKQSLEAQLLMDLCMMMLTTGEERDEKKWNKLFLDAGFSGYKISHIFGSRSLIEVYP